MPQVRRLTLDARRQALALGIMRLVLGGALMAAPGRLLPLWMGPEEQGPRMRLVTRLAAARDIALGLGTVLAVRHDTGVRAWLEAGVLADSSDAVTHVLSWRQLPPASRVLVPASAAAAAAVGRRLASRIG